MMRWLGLLALVALLGLAACGGGTRGDAPPASWPEVASVQGTAYSADERLVADEVYVKGASGIYRHVQTDAARAYTAKLDGLAGPYAVALRVVSASTGQEGFLVSFATAAGTANATPLSTLVAAELTGQDPTTYFQGLANAGDPVLAAVTDAALQAAQARVAGRLARDFGITLPADANILAAASTARAGDPWFDAATTLTARLQAQGRDVLDYARDVARHAVLCNAERLAVTDATGTADFCPRSKATTPDPADTTHAQYLFTADDGAVLSLEARASLVIGIAYTDAAGRGWACSGTGCAGVGIGAPAADGTRALQFSLALQGAAGPLSLAGTLIGPKPGAVLPPLACDTNRYYVIRPDDSVDATCAAPDSVTGSGVGETLPSGTHRRIYRFATDGSAPATTPMLELRIDDASRVASVLVYDLDPQSGLPRPLFRCVGSDCGGVTVGEAVDDPDSFAPYVIRLRTLTLDHTVVAAIEPDGTPAAGGPAQVVAELTSVEIVPPQPLQPQACASPAQRLTALASDETTAWDVCPPADPTGFEESSFLSTAADATGLSFMLASLYADGLSATVGGPVVVHADTTGSVDTMTFTSIDGTLFRCAPCSGVQVGEAQADGSRLITANAAALAEVETAGLPGQRSVRIDGSFTAPPPAAEPQAAPRGGARR